MPRGRQQAHLAPRRARSRGAGPRAAGRCRRRRAAFVLGEREAGLDGRGAVDEQLRRPTTRGARSRLAARPRVRRRQRRDLVHAARRGCAARCGSSRGTSRIGASGVQPHEHRARHRRSARSCRGRSSTRRPAEGVRDALLERGLAVVADAERVRDRRQQQPGLEHALEEHEVRRRRGRGRPLARRDLDREPALADAAGADQADDPARRRVASRSRTARDRPLAADGRRVAATGTCARARRRMPRRRLPTSSRDCVEALGEEGREVVGDLLLEFVGRVEGEVGGGVVGADAVDQLVQALVAVVATP